MFAVLPWQITVLLLCCNTVLLYCCCVAGVLIILLKYRTLWGAWSTSGGKLEHLTELNSIQAAEVKHRTPWSWENVTAAFLQILALWQRTHRQRANAPACQRTSAPTRQ